MSPQARLRVRRLVLCGIVSDKQLSVRNLELDDSASQLRLFTAIEVRSELKLQPSMQTLILRVQTGDLVSSSARSVCSPGRAGARLGSWHLQAVIGLLASVVGLVSGV